MSAIKKKLKKDFRWFKYKSVIIVLSVILGFILAINIDPYAEPLLIIGCIVGFVLLFYAFSVWLFADEEVKEDSNEDTQDQN